VKVPSCWPTGSPGLTPEQQEIVEILDSSSRNLQKLIEQLLDYNRKQADGPVAREAVDLVDLVENVVAAHSLPARAKLMHTELTLQARRCGRACAIDKRNG
jgi:two-component system sensor histidine kinase GlrK